jgi:hypothetical protein
VPGIYTTRQFEASPDQAESAIATLNTQINGGNYPVEGGNTLITYMNNIQFLPATSYTFTAVPSDATQLQSAMKFFTEEMDANANELLNSWGAVVVTEPQKNLKRVDVIITWDEVQVNGGSIVLDSNGKSIVVNDANGKPIRRINSDHFYIHRDAQYFLEPGG